MFIELTDIANKEGINICQVNINKIISYARYEESTTVIKFEGGGYIITSESYEQVKSLIENKVQAERGYQYE